MELSTAQQVVEKLEDNGIEAQVYEGYSGRGMFGRTTAGVQLNHRYDMDDAEDICPELKLAKVSQDSLGLGVILY